MTLLFITFVSLSIMGFLRHDLRKETLGRSSEEWNADIFGLLIQGIVIPAIPFILLPFMAYLFPEWERKIEVSPVFQFLISFVIIDYLYYWNHRIFHFRTMWHHHRLHHSSRHLDIFATSRNSLMANFMFIYVWFQLFGLYFLKDGQGFFAGLLLTFALDLWRHSGIESSYFIRSTLGLFLILPEHHILHHSLDGRNKNFGANFSFWDRLHGTFSSHEIKNRNLEKPPGKNIWKEILLPRKAGK